MKISASRHPSHASVAILHLDGQLDSSNYREFVSWARGLFAGGARDLLIDLRKLDFMSSSGLVALHSVARLFGGLDEAPEIYRSIDPAVDRGIPNHVKLLGPQMGVAHVLEVAGLQKFFQVFDDLESALKSFPF